MKLQFAGRLGFASILSVLVWMGTANAQTNVGVTPSTSQQSGPAGIAAEPVVFFPGVDVAFGHNDNLFLTQNQTRSSNYWIVSPWVKMEGKPGPHVFEVLARGDFGSFISSPNDDYTDYKLIGNGRFVLDGRSDLSLHAEATQGHDPRGSTDRPAGNAPDIYDNNGVEGTFGFGANQAQGRLELNGGRYSRKYTNNRVFTEASDRSTSFGGATFLWRVSPRTQILAQAESRQIDYDLDASTQSSTETRMYVGLRWDVTAVTSGTAKFGRVKKDFDSGLRTDVTSTSWDVGARWSPVTYSWFDLNTSRQTQESTGVGDSVLSSTYGLAWNHSWNSRFTSRLRAGFTNDEFTGVGVTREDQIQAYSAGLIYDFRRWLKFGAEYTLTDRDSNIPGLDYTKNLIQVTARFTL